jgi:drug/metabolite transporter (DMT)-like permease
VSIPAAYTGVILIWSTTPIAIKWSGEEVGFLFGVTGRMALGAALSLALVRLLGHRLPWDRDARRTYLAAGLNHFLAMLAVYWSAQQIPSGWISVIFGLTPLVTAVLASLWLTESSLTPARLGGMLLGLLGLGLMFASGRRLGPQAVAGVLGVLFSVLVHSASAVWVKRIGARLSALALTAGSLLVALPLYLALGLVTGALSPQHVPLRAAAAIAYLGAVGSVLGFGLYFYVLQRVEATRTALITLITPVLALLVGRFAAAEPIGARVMVGTAAIIGGLLLFQLGSRAAAARAPEPA